MVQQAVVFAWESHRRRDPCVQNRNLHPRCKKCFCFSIPIRNPSSDYEAAGWIRLDQRWCGNSDSAACSVTPRADVSGWQRVALHSQGWLYYYLIYGTCCMQACLYLGSTTWAEVAQKACWNFKTGNKDRIHQQAKYSVVIRWSVHWLKKNNPWIQLGCMIYIPCNCAILLMHLIAETFLVKIDAFYYLDIVTK